MFSIEQNAVFSRHITCAKYGLYGILGACLSKGQGRIRTRLRGWVLGGEGEKASLLVFLLF